MSGYGGKSNWHADRDAKPPALYQALPACTKAPWRPDRCEVRAIYVPSCTLAEFESFVKEHTGPARRFLDPIVTDSADVKLTHRSLADIARYLINYVGRDPRYIEESRNCQTFAADFFGFLAGRKGVEPYSSYCRVRYKSRPYLFLYEPDMYAVPQRP